MKKITLISIFLFIFSSISYLNAQWARTYGGSEDDIAYFIQQTSDGGYIIVGETSSFGAGGSDIWVLKLASSGDIEWQKTFGKSNTDYAQSIQQTNDGGYIIAGSTYNSAAGTSYDVWILKLTSSGEIDWQYIYGGSFSDKANSIQQTSDGGYIIACQTKSWGLGNGDIWILKLSSIGNIEWENSYGGNGEDSAYSIQQTNDNGYIVAGQTKSWGAGYFDIWILKLSSIGNIEWQKLYGGSGEDSAYSIRQTSDGGYIAAGETSSFGAGDGDFWVLKLTSSGDIEWQRSYGGIYSDKAYSIQQTSEGGYIVAGSTFSFDEATTYDSWILKLLSMGDIEWEYAYGYNVGFFHENEHAYSMQQTSEGGYIIAGSSSLGAGEDDFFLAKTYAEGDISPLCHLVESSTALITDTSISPENTNITPLFTTMETPVSFDGITIETVATVNTICEAAKYSLTISSTDRGTTEPAPGLYTYYDQTEVQILAIPEPAYNFLHWTGDVPQGHETDNPLTITMDSDKSIRANFQYTLTINVVVGGTTEPEPGSYTYDSGKNVSVTAIPDTGYRFSGWTGDVPLGHENDNPLEIAMDSDKSIIANFIRQYTLTIAAGIGGITYPSPDTYTFDEGEQVTITATPDNGYRFVNWSGDVSSTDNPITITMDSDKSINANFIRQYTLIIAAGTGGTTDPSPGSNTHDSGASVSVRAIPSSGYQFSGWSGDASGTTNPITITMDSDKSISASFTSDATDGDDEGRETGGGGGCFIATAAYGSALHPYVKILRDFRDKYLMPKMLGRKLVYTYYKYSPPFADLIAKNKALKIVVQINLIPIIVISYVMVHSGSIISGIFIILVFFLLISKITITKRRIF